MNDYRRLRKALEAIRDWPYSDQHDFEGMRRTAKNVLANTPEESEIERLKVWLLDQKPSDDDPNIQWQYGWVAGMLDVLDHIQSEFLGGEDATE